MSLIVLHKLLAIFIAVAVGWFAGKRRWLGRAVTVSQSSTASPSLKSLPANMRADPSAGTREHAGARSVPPQLPGIVCRSSSAMPEDSTRPSRSKLTSKTFLSCPLMNCQRHTASPGLVA